MVEGPQVTYFATKASKFKNKNLTDIEIKKGRYKSHPLKNLKIFKKSLPLKLIDVFKKGKVIFFRFQQGWTIIFKFGMTGQFYIEDDSNEDVEFVFGDRSLFFQDTRHFGTITITNDQEMIESEIERIAPDILDSRTRFSDVQIKIENLSPNKKLDQVLMDQKEFLSGIGNIAKSEIMYLAKISPKRKVSQISNKEWKKIFDSAKKVVGSIYAKIKKGNWDFDTKIYQQESDPNGNSVKSFVSSDGRKTFWVPIIQK